MIFYRVLADFVLPLHAAFVAFVVVGEMAVLYGLARRRGWARAFWFRWLHLASIAFVVLSSWLGATCPLTGLENSLRERGGGGGYPDDFISYWARELLFYECSIQALTATMLTPRSATTLASFASLPILLVVRPVQGSRQVT